MRLILLISLIAFLNPAIANSKELSAYGPTCERIGFKPKTPAYGKCILELSRDDLSRNDISVPSASKNQPLPPGFARTQKIVWSNISGVNQTGGGEYDFNEAFSNCNAMNSSGSLGYSNGWRLPTRQEISVLYNHVDTSKPNLEGLKLWSSESGGNESHYYGLIKKGFVIYYRAHDSAKLDTTCVHESGD
jgi:hypothetical protein